MKRLGLSLLFCLLGAWSAAAGATLRVCASGCDFSDFQAAMYAARGGDVIELEAGQVFSGVFTVPPRSAGEGYVHVRSSRWRELPPEGYRISPSDVPLMATIEGGLYMGNTTVGIAGADVNADAVVLSGNHGAKIGDWVWFWAYGGVWGTLPGGVAMVTAYCVVDVPGPNSVKLSLECGGPPVDITSAGVAGDRRMFRAATPAYWRFEGIEIRPPLGGFLYTLVAIGDNEPRIELMPHHIEFLRTYIHGNPNEQGPQRCVAANGTYLTFRDSYISECKQFGPDTQAIACWNCPGPIYIENNYLEGAGENILVGGASVTIPYLLNGQNGGIVVRGNHLKKPYRWKYSNGLTEPSGACRWEGNEGEFYEKIVGVVSADPATDVITTATPHGLSVGAEVRVTGGYEWQGIDVFGKTVRYVRSTPTATTLTLSNTAGGPVLDITANITGTTALAITGYRCMSGVWTAVPPNQSQMRFTFKNLFELKNAYNVVMEANVLENTWPDAQGGGWLASQVDNFNIWSTVRNVYIRNNISRNMSYGIAFASDGVDQFPNKIGQFFFLNNLHYAPASYYYGGLIQTLHEGLFDHNTWILTGYAYRFEGNSKNITLSNSIFMGTGGIGSPAGQGCVAHPNTVNGLKIAHNMFSGNAYDAGWPGSFSSCGTGNVWLSAPDPNQFVNAAAANFRLAQGSQGIRAGNDGRDLGADIDELENATSGTVAGTPTWSAAAKLRIDSTNAQAAVLMYDAPGNEPCQVQLDDNPTFASLHPDTLTTQLQSDARTGNVMDGPFRQFVFGRNHALSASTRYYYRVSCGNRVMPGQFETLAAGGAAGSVAWPVKLSPLPESGVAKARIEYGDSPSLGSSTDPVDCAGGVCELTFPAVRQAVVYWRFVYLSASDQEIAAGSVTATAVP